MRFSAVKSGPSLDFTPLKQRFFCDFCFLGLKKAVKKEVNLYLGPWGYIIDCTTQLCGDYYVGSLTKKSFNHHLDVSENSGFCPQIILFNRVFHDFHHPFWGTPIFGNTQVNLYLGGGFKCFFMFTPTWGRFQIWRIFFRWVVQPPSSYSFSPYLSWFSARMT